MTSARLRRAIVFNFCLVYSCSACHPASKSSTTATAESNGSEAAVKNESGKSTTVWASFSPDSKVTREDWISFCKPVTSGCMFHLGVDEIRYLQTSGKFLSVNLSFGQPGSCEGTGVTLGEMSLNTSNNHDTVDISMVNGWNVDIKIDIAPKNAPKDASFGGLGAVTLGPTDGPDSGALRLGVFPNGCDICVARQKPPCPWQTPCGTPDGGGVACGCQGGTQYNPSPVCQEQISQGSLVTVVLVKQTKRDAQETNLFMHSLGLTTQDAGWLRNPDGAYMLAPPYKCPDGWVNNPDGSCRLVR
jgi:hypothetical protein